MIKETTLEITCSLQNYENLKLSATGGNIEELREYLIDQLNNFGTMDEVVRGCIDSYVKRVLSKPKDIKCADCEAKGTELCNTCPDKEECNTDNLNTHTSDSNKTNPKSEIESGQLEGTGFKKANQVTEKQDTFKTPEEFKKYNETKCINPNSEIESIQNTTKDPSSSGLTLKDCEDIKNIMVDAVKQSYDNGMKTNIDMRNRDPNKICTKCGADIFTPDLRICDLMGIANMCKDCREELKQGKQ